ncbi:uncharacterized protein LOC144928150 isoform X2 [Branchiostoma floridae x Branchiostoma belcheri]
MTKGDAPASKPWRVKGTSRKDRSRKRDAERVEEENVRTEGHATRMVQVACKRLYAQINANFRRGKKQYTRDDKFVQAKLYDIICDEARKLWSQSAVSMVRLNYKHDILANGPRGPAEKGPPRIALMMTWPWCKLALEVRRVPEKYHYSYQSVRNCFARMSYLVWMGGCHVGLVALFGTKEDMQKADLDLYCTPLGGESVVDIALAKDAMALFGYGDTKGMNKAEIPWAYQKDLKVNCIMNKFEPTEGFCVRVYRVHPSRSGRFKEKFSDEDRLNKLYAEYAEYEDRQQVLEKDDSAFPSGDSDDSSKYFSPDDIRKDVDKVDIYLQCGAWDYMRAHEEYKEILKRVNQPAAGEGDLISGGKRKMPGQDIEFDYLAERLKDRIQYTHQEVKPPPPPPETDDLYVAGPSPEAEAPSIEPTASPDEILAAYVASAGKPHQQGSLFAAESVPELAEEATQEVIAEIAVRDPEVRRQSSVKARQRWRGLRPSLFAEPEGPVGDDEDLYTGGAATAAIHEWLTQRSFKSDSGSYKGTVASRGTRRSRGSYKYIPPKEDVTMGDEPLQYVSPEEEVTQAAGSPFRKQSRVSFKSKREAKGTVRSRGSVKYLPPKDAVSVGNEPEKFMIFEDEDGNEIEEEDKPEIPIKRMSTKKRQAVSAAMAAMPPRPGLQRTKSLAFSDTSDEPTTDDVVINNTLPGSMKLSGEFTEELADPSSPEFMELASATKSMLEQSLAKELGDSFYAVQITGFKKGSVVAEFVVIMADDADKPVQKDVTKIIKKAAKNGVAGRTILPESVDIEEPQSLSRRQSQKQAPGAEEDDKKKRKWSSKLKMPKKPSFKLKEAPEEKAEEEPEEDTTPLEEQKEPEQKMFKKPELWKSLRMIPTQPQEEVTPPEEQKEQAEPEPKAPRKLPRWKSLRMPKRRKEEKPVESGESTDDSSPETEVERETAERRIGKEVELSVPILLNTPEEKSPTAVGDTPKHSPVPVKRVASAASDLPLPEAEHLKRYDSDSVMNALQYGEEHVEPIKLNTSSKKQKPPKIKLLERRKSPSLSRKKGKDKKGPKLEGRVKYQPIETAPIPTVEQPEDHYLEFRRIEPTDQQMEFRRNEPTDKQTPTEVGQKTTLQEKIGSGRGFDPTSFNLPIISADRPRSKVDMVELKNVLAKKQQLKEETSKQQSVEFKEPKEQIREDAPAINLPKAPAERSEDEKEFETTELMQILAKKQQRSEDKQRGRPLGPPKHLAGVVSHAMMEFGSSKKKKDSLTKSSLKGSLKKSPPEETERKSSMKSSKKSSLKKAPEDQLEAQTATLDLGESASLASAPRYELAPYDYTMDTIQHDRDQGLFAVRGNFNSPLNDGVAEVFVDGDWEDPTQPRMEAAPPADMQMNIMPPRRVYAASDVSSMVATWQFDPEWGSIDLPPSEIDEQIVPTKPTEIESSMVVPRAETPDVSEDEISDRDSVSSDNTEDSRFSVVRVELEPEDKERMTVKLPGEIVAPVVPKTKKKAGDPGANADDKGCVVM